MAHYFHDITNLPDLKAAYRVLALKHHPDCGGSTAIMQEINAEYTALHEALKAEHNASADAHHQTTEAPAEFIDIISTLVRMEGITVELCGSWLWIGGNTRPHKETLKAAGCAWSARKQLWSWHHAEDGSRYYRGKTTMAEIRQKYGSQTFTANGKEQQRIGA